MGVRFGSRQTEGNDRKEKNERCEKDKEVYLGNGGGGDRQSTGRGGEQPCP